MTSADAICDLSFVLRCCDDEERVGHVITRLCRHLRGLDLRFELLVVDERSGDNTLAIAALLRGSNPEVETLHAAPGRAYVVAADRARGRLLAFADVRQETPLSLIGYALSRIDQGSDIVSASKRLLVFRRTRSLKLFDALFTLRRGIDHSRFVRRGKSLGLVVAEVHPRRHRVMEILRGVLPRRLAG